MGKSCFSSCSRLTTIIIPNSITTLGDGCFDGCSSLTSITIPNSVTSLGKNCFSGCSSLTTITIPNSVTSLGGYCFSSCWNLTSITIPKSVTSIGNYCFYNSSSLTSIIMLPPTPPTVGAKIFAYTPLKTVYVKDEKTKTRYEAAAPWNEYEIVVLNATGIENTEMGNNAAITADCYDLNGRRITGKKSGLAFIRYSDGSTRKVIVR